MSTEEDCELYTANFEKVGDKNTIILPTLEPLPGQVLRANAPRDGVMELSWAEKGVE